MNESPQPRLLGFSGAREVPDETSLRQALRSELGMMRTKFGNRLTALSSAAAGADLVFLRACVDLRIPFILILPYPRQRLAEGFENPGEWTLAEHLMSVALAEYVAPGGNPAPEACQAVSSHLLEWADAFFFAWNDETYPDAGMTRQTLADARDLGIPSRIIDPSSLAARWTSEPDPGRGARHGFESRKELLEFFDERFR